MGEKNPRLLKNKHEVTRRTSARSSQFVTDQVQPQSNTGQTVSDCFPVHSWHNRMNPRDSPGYDIGPDVDRRGMHGNRISRPAVQTSSDLNTDDLEEDTPGAIMTGIRQRFPGGNVIGMPGVFARPVFEPLDESTDPPLSHRQNSMENGFSYQNGHHMSDSSLDEVARGTSPWASEAVRLSSFRNWPYHVMIPTILPEDLAKNGFRYVGPMDTVQCVFCRQRLKHWEEGDTVRGEHMKFKPNCPLLSGQATQNVPIATDEERSAILQTHVHRPELTEQQMPRVEQPREEEMSLEAPQAKYPQFCVEATRLATYTGWPTQMNQKPEQLSKAGFFYLNRGDTVCCFFCGETVVEWEKEDDPWVEHAKISPNCYFVKMVKGEEFIQVAKKGMNMASGSESESVESLLTKPAALALRHEGYSTEELSVALARMIHRNAGRDVYSASAIQAELNNIDREKAVSRAEPTQQGAAACPPDTENSNKGVKDLEEENRQLREQRTCKVCLESEISIIFLPCGHLVCCASCGLALHECPICRQHISKTTKAYWA